MNFLTENIGLELSIFLSLIYYYSFRFINRFLIEDKDILSDYNNDLIKSIFILNIFIISFNIIFNLNFPKYVFMIIIPLIYLFYFMIYNWYIKNLMKEEIIEKEDIEETNDIINLLLEKICKNCKFIDSMKYTDKGIMFQFNKKINEENDSGSEDSKELKEFLDKLDIDD